MKKVLFVLAIAFGLDVNAQICFGSASNFPADSLPSCVTSADFNKDGKLDIAVTNYHSNNISVSLGDGMGGFGIANNFSVGTGPMYLTNGDFNGDSTIDLAVANYTSKSISILLGNGTGGFQTPTSYTTQCGPYSLINADFNNDGKIDLATADYSCGSSTIFLGVGDGTFNLDTLVYNVGVDPISVTSGDYNADGFADIALACNNINFNLSILYGAGNGSFYYNETDNLGFAGFPTSITSNYFDGDTLIDLAVSFDGGGVVMVLLNSTINFTETIIGGNGSSGCTSFSSLISDDFNGDCKNDIGMVGGCFDVVSIFLGTGIGTFSTDTNISLGSGFYNPFNITSADFNGDGKLDFVTANQHSSDVSVLLNCLPTNILSVSDSLYQDTLPFTWDILPHYSSNVTNVIWYWGDGTSTNSLYPSHTYSLAGHYNICATVFSSCGDSASFCQNDSLYRLSNNSMNSNMVYVNVKIATTSENQLSVNNLQTILYPNPSSGNFILETNTTTKQTMQLFDVNGRVVLTQTINGKTTIDASALPNGIYNVSITSNEGIVNKRMVIAK